MKKTIFIATVLAATTLLAAGLVVFPSSVQEAQANPCSVNEQGGGGDEFSETNTHCDFEGIGSLDVIEIGGPGMDLGVAVPEQ